MRTVLLCLLLGAAPIATSQAAPIYDDFNDNALDASLWTVIADGTGVTTSEVNQRVEVIIGADASGNFSGGYRSNAVFSGDIDITVAFSLLDWPAKTGVRVGLALLEGAWPPQSYWNMDRVSCGVPEICTEIYITDYNHSISTPVLTLDTSGALRLARHGNTLSAYFLGNGNWSHLRSDPVTTGDVSFGFAAWSDDYLFGNQPVRVAFDDVTVVSTVVPLPTTALPLLTAFVTAAWRVRRRAASLASSTA